MNTGIDGSRSAHRARIATGAAFAALILAPLLPTVLRAGTPAALLTLPFEAVAVLILLVALPGRAAGALVAAVFAVVVVLATLVAALDLGFEATIDRAFSLIDDGDSLVSAFGVVGDAVGVGNAFVLVILLVCLLIAAAVLLARAALQAGRTTRRAGGSGRLVLAAAATAWILCALVGARSLPGVEFAGSDATTTLVAASAQTVQGIQQQQAFQHEVQTDRLAGVPADQLLTALKGKDVVVAFLESYGKVAVQGSTFSPGVDQVLRAGGEQLTQDGYSAQSAFLASPTFGGVSWLAHSTLQSGVWVDSQSKYDSLTAGHRLTLTRAFGDAGWHTVSVIPSDTGAWPQGKAFYGYDEMFNALNVGYRGPKFSYARIPDQYTWKKFYDTELATPHSPVMAEIDFVSSHTPWTPLPHAVPWSALGDGSIFAPQPAEGLAPVVAWQDPHEVQKLYGQSVEYTLGALFSFLHTYDQPNLVLVVLGDHQPARIVSGADADHDVPITIIAKDPAVFSAISSWHWDAGVKPSSNAPVWRMSLFRDRFLSAFSP